MSRSRHILTISLRIRVILKWSNNTGDSFCKSLAVKIGIESGSLSFSVQIILSISRSVFPCLFLIFLQFDVVIELNRRFLAVTISYSVKALTHIRLMLSSSITSILLQINARTSLITILHDDHFTRLDIFMTHVIRHDQTVRERAAR